ncbi:acyltransferase family protein [Sphingobium sp. H39-3-25]|uniref:acyltransferase n=1 Tax=Sphingobium arseniciresistens TaxID=3030834 RepID=UPI0023B90E73|nr:acyltransferase family protein [Sphingobium arseniciresistens]
MQGRILGVDAARYLLSLFVIILHAMPNTPPGTALWPEMISVVTRAAVPFFFIASGYFLKPARSAHPDMVSKHVLRLAPVFGFWILAYVLLARSLDIGGAFRWRDILSGGPGFHLWFLPALGFGLASVSLSLALVGERATTGWCIALAIFGLLSSSYHDLVFGHGIERRGGLMIAPSFILLGAWARRHDVRLSTPLAAMLTLGSLLLVFAEELAISHFSATPFQSHDFTLSTILYGGSVFLLSLSLPENPVTHRLAALGSISLGIYVSHLAFLWLIYGHLANTTWPGALLIALVAFSCATLFSLMAANIPLLRRVAA